MILKLHGSQRTSENVTTQHSDLYKTIMISYGDTQNSPHAYKTNWLYNSKRKSIFRSTTACILLLYNTETIMHQVSYCIVFNIANHSPKTQNWSIFWRVDDDDGDAPLVFTQNSTLYNKINEFISIQHNTIVFKIYNTIKRCKTVIYNWAIYILPYLILIILWGMKIVISELLRFSVIAIF